MEARRRKDIPPFAPFSLQALPLTSLGLACWLGPFPLGCGRPLAAPTRQVGVGPRNPGSEVGVVVSSLACGWPRAPCAPCAIPAGEGKTTSNAAASRPPSQTVVWPGWVAGAGGRLPGPRTWRQAHCPPSWELAGWRDGGLGAPCGTGSVLVHYPPV